MAPQNNGPRLAVNKYGTWEIRWSEDRRSMRKSTNTTDRGAAELALAAFLQCRSATTRNLQTVGSVLTDYMQEHVERGPVVDKQRQRDIIANLTPFFSSMRPTDVTPADVLRYCDRRRDGRVGARCARSDGTLRRELNTLIAALNHAVKARRLPVGDVPHIPLPAQPGARDFWLTEDEVRELLAECDARPGRGALFVRIALATAARRRSIEGLTWAQVDLAARRIQFNPNGRRQTIKRRVALPISDALLPYLEAASQRRAGDWVLDTNKPITRALEALCAAAYRRTGNSRFLLVTPHTLRHTAATIMARAGVSAFEIAGVLGDSLQTVQRAYLHHAPDHLRSAVNVIGARTGAHRADSALSSPDGGRHRQAAE